MKKTIAIFTLAFLCQTCSFTSAQETGDSNSFLYPRVARLKSSPESAEPVLVDLDVDLDSPLQMEEDNTPIRFDGLPAAENLEEREAEVQGRIFSDGLRLLGYAALLICAAIAGLVFYGQRQQISRRRRHHWD